MSARILACPTCQATLQVAEPLPASGQIQCPQCGSSYVVTAPLGQPTAPAASRPKGRVLALALAAVVLFAVTGIMGAGCLSKDSDSKSNGDKQTVSDDERKQIEADRKKLAEKEKLLEEKEKKIQQDALQAEYDRLMEQGAAALAKQKYDDAVQAYESALKLFPKDVDAAKGLGEAKKLRDAVVKDNKDKQTDEERQAELKRLMEKGKEAMAKKEYAAAVTTFETATKLVPSDAAAAVALNEAKQALAADQDEKKRLAEYEKHMENGRAAMTAGRYADAIRDYTAALRVVPGDDAALKAQRLAEKRLEGIQDEEKRKSEYSKLMQNGADALTRQRYDEAIQAFNDALRVMPGDRVALQRLREAQNALNQVKGDFNRAMERGEQAMRAQRFEEAVRHFAEAVRLLPGDENATRSLRNAEKILRDIEAAQQAYFRYMQQGEQAMRNQRFGEAVLAFSEALRLVPNDMDANRRLRDARRAQEDDVRKRAEFDRLMQNGTNALNKRLYADAIKAFTEAQQLYPDETRVVAPLRQARFSQSMADGEAAMKAKKYGEAVRAFEDAIKEAPNNQAAQLAENNLKQAKLLMRKP